jgi:hypothetical protein
VYRNDYEDGLPLVIRLKSKVVENSLVPIGADKAAKFRSLFTDETETETKEEHENNQKQIDAEIDQMQMEMELLNLNKQP